MAPYSSALCQTLRQAPEYIPMLFQDSKMPLRFVLFSAGSIDFPSNNYLTYVHSHVYTYHNFPYFGYIFFSLLQISKIHTQRSYIKQSHPQRGETEDSLKMWEKSDLHFLQTKKSHLRLKMRSIMCTYATVPL